MFVPLSRSPVKSKREAASVDAPAENSQAATDSAQQNSFAKASEKQRATPVASKTAAIAESDILGLASELIEKYNRPSFAQPITRHRASQ